MSARDQVNLWMVGEAANQPTRLMKLPEVLMRTGIQRSSLYKLVKERRFPPPAKCGGASLWVEAEVEAWIQRLLATRKTAA